MSDIRLIPDIVEEPAPLELAPDYPLEARVHVNQPQQWKAVADPTRRSILDLVMERAATTSELAIALGRPKGTIDHHLKVLQEAGLLRVVRTRKVRAMTERYWGRTARTIMFDDPVDGQDGTTMFLREALEEIAEVSARPEFDDRPGFSTLRHARIADERMKEFIERLEALALEFSGCERGGSTVFALLIAGYPTLQPVLP